MMCERQETKYGLRMGAKQLKPVILSESERRRSEDESKEPDNDCRMNTALSDSDLKQASRHKTCLPKPASLSLPSCYHRMGGTPNEIRRDHNRDRTSRHTSIGCARRSRMDCGHGREGQCGRHCVNTGCTP